MKNLFTKNRLAVACLSCLAFIGTACNESIKLAVLGTYGVGISPLLKKLL